MSRPTRRAVVTRSTEVRTWKFVAKHDISQLLMGGELMVPSSEYTIHALSALVIGPSLTNAPSLTIQLVRGRCRLTVAILSFALETMTLKPSDSTSRQAEPMAGQTIAHIDEVTQAMRASTVETSPVAAMFYLSDI
jgi:hypothetical protein